VLSPTGNKNLYHIHPIPRSKKDLLMPAPTYTLLFRQELFDSQDRAVLALIDNRARLNEILARIEGKYLDKITEALKNNHFMQGLSKSAIQKFVLDGALGKGYGEILLYKVPTSRNKVIYREGEVADRVFFVIKGEYELSRKLHKGVSEGTAGVIERFGGRKVPPPGYR
jgi:hypothetical protein